MQLYPFPLMVSYVYFQESLRTPTHQIQTLSMTTFCPHQSLKICVSQHCSIWNNAPLYYRPCGRCLLVLSFMELKGWYVVYLIFSDTSLLTYPWVCNDLFLILDFKCNQTVCRMRYCSLQTMWGHPKVNSDKKGEKKNLVMDKQSISSVLTFLLSRMNLSVWFSDIIMFREHGQ